eukprot:5771281-Prymnesium_polylepis.1
MERCKTCWLAVCDEGRGRPAAVRGTRRTTWRRFAGATFLLYATSLDVHVHDQQPRPAQSRRRSWPSGRAPGHKFYVAVRVAGHRLPLAPALRRTV